MLRGSAMKPKSLMRTVRYAKSWKRSSSGIESTQVSILRDGQEVPATFVRPVGETGRLPCWIAIGGVSRKGRFHPQLVRFTEALASTGVAVLVPGLPEWRRLSVSPRVTLPTVRASVDYLNGRGDVIPGRFGVIGFSFGAAGVAIAASHEEIAAQISGAVLFGGYCCLERTLACMLTGEHEWDEHRHRLRPDPYGRWVVASNYLTRVPGYEDATDVAQAAGRLAAEASGRRVSAWEPYHDAMIADLRETIPERRRLLFDILATPTTDRRPDRETCGQLARALSDACRALEPELDPAGSIHRVLVPTQVIHGRGDRLVPFTEGIRLMDRLPDDVRRGVTVTRMFNHSKDHVPSNPLEHAVEAGMLFRALHRLVNTV
jgi:pimeloyl-ACP methyl ester carboxylesterase